MFAKLSFRAAVLLLAMACVSSVVAQIAPEATAPAQTPPAQTERSAPSVSPDVTRDIVPEFTADLRAVVRRLPLEFDRMQKAAERLRGDGAGLEELRGEIEELRGQLLATIGELEPLQPKIAEQLAGLGDPPKDGAPAEPRAVARDRAALEQARADVDAATKRMRLTETRVGQLLERVQLKRRDLLARDLLRRFPSPLSSSVWSTMAEQSTTVFTQVHRVLRSWFDLLEINWITALGLIITTILSYVFALHGRDQVLRGLLDWTEELEDPVSFFRRSRVAAYLAPVFAAPRLIAASVLAFGIYATELYNWQIDQILLSLLIAFVSYTIVASLARSVLVPGHARIRLVGVDDYGALRLSRLICLVAFVWGADLVIQAIAQSLYLDGAFEVVASFLINVALAGLLVAIVTTRIADEESTEGGQLMSRVLGWLKLPVYIMIVVVMLASLTGYVALGRFIMTQMMLLGCAGMALFLVHRGVANLTRLPNQAGNEFVQAAGTAPETETVDWTARLIRYGLMTAVVSIVLAVLMLSWGFSWSDIIGYGRQLVFGFEIGNVRISPAQIVLALALFLGLLFLTRLIRRWLQANVLTAKSMDVGLANSIDTGIAYAGVALAAMAAVSYAGLDITNLAIVAGALSVGIGFGLQSIVNNFVSGLILLVERPIKVGDWIVVAGQEGYVRRISVRATEIETFDRASLILPNSELITGVVQNWTHRNALGRIVVPVGVSYSADPEQVIELLAEVAGETEGILKFPAPFISFDNLGDSALEFTVRAYIRDINNALSAKTALRVAIVKALRQAEIEIPFPQQDIHLRDLDGVKAAFQRAAEQKLAEAMQQRGADTAPESMRDREDGIRRKT